MSATIRKTISYSESGDCLYGGREYSLTAVDGELGDGYCVSTDLGELIADMIVSCTDTENSNFSCVLEQIITRIKCIPAASFDYFLLPYIELNRVIDEMKYAGEEDIKDITRHIKLFKEEK